ncbi:MAG: ABC transporter permease [Paracoccaceae bacterium]|nr:ABC transporter permease [Paracoccaceae bacterium]
MLNQSRTRILAAPRATTALMLREMVTSYGRSPGGYLWAVLEPVAAIALLSIVFAAAFQSPSLGRSFPLFYASGFLPFLMFNDLVNRLASALRFSRPLLAYPAVTFLDALLARFLLNLGTHIIVALLVIGGILMLFETATVLRPGPLALGLAMTAALAFGIGVFNCFMLSAFPVWDRLWQIVSRPLFVISGIFFLLEDVPQPFRDWLWFNPLIHITGEVRRGVYATYEPGWVSPIYVFALSLVAAVLGLMLLRRHYKELLER